MFPKLNIGLLVVSYLGIFSPPEGSAGPVAFQRTEEGSDAWNAEKGGIIRSFRKGVKGSEGTRIVPLFMSSRLVLRSPVSKDGVILHETAFIYSEDKVGEGGITKKVSVFVRRPYGAREWSTEVMVNVMEHGESLESVLEIDNGKDTFSQISNFVRKVTAPAIKGEYTIALVVFEQADKEVLGRVLTEEDLHKMCDHDYTDPEPIPTTPENVD